MCADGTDDDDDWMDGQIVRDALQSKGFDGFGGGNVVTNARTVIKSYAPHQPWDEGAGVVISTGGQK